MALKDQLLEHSGTTEFCKQMAKQVLKGDIVTLNECVFIIIESIIDNGISPIVNVYPNPTKNVIWFELNDTQEKLWITIEDYSGKIVFNQVYSNEQKLSIDMKNIATGAYNIIVTTPNYRGVVKVMKVN